MEALLFLMYEHAHTEVMIDFKDGSSISVIVQKPEESNLKKKKVHVDESGITVMHDGEEQYHMVYGENDATLGFLQGWLMAHLISKEVEDVSVITRDGTMPHLGIMDVIKVSKMSQDDRAGFMVERMEEKKMASVK